jgi:FAD:protein FMN transferase
MKKQYHVAFDAMGCQMDAWLETEADGVTLLQALPDQVASFEERLSRFRPTSELMQLNAHSGEWVHVSSVLLENVLAAKHAARLTNGLYNPLILPALVAAGYDRSFDQITAMLTPEIVPPIPIAPWSEIEIDIGSSTVRLPAGSALDLGGVAKGWTAATIADELAAYGSCLFSAGGDIVARGTRQGRFGWTVAVAEPGSDAANVLHVLLQDRAVVTSGVDRRYWQHKGQRRHHIIDPRTGQPAQTDVQSVTIIHPHAPTAEAYAKAVLLLGSKAGLVWLNKQWDSAGMVVRNDKAVLATTNWQSFIVREKSA